MAAASRSLFTKAQTLRGVPEPRIFVGYKGGGKGDHAFVANKSTRRARRSWPCFKAQASPDVEDLNKPAATSTPRYCGKKAIVIGASMAGTIAAAYLAQQGFAVKVYEQRGDPLKGGQSQQYANLVRILPNAVAVVKEAGVDLPIDGYRNGVHRAKGGARSTPTALQFWQLPDNSPFCSYIGARNQFAAIFSEDVRNKWSDSVSFLYNQSCINIDFDEKQAAFEDSEGNRSTEHYDLLIAADGAQSVVRRMLQAHDSTLKVASFRHYGGCKTIRNLPFLGEEEEVMKGVRPGWGMFFSQKRGLMFRDSGPGQAFFSFFRPSAEETVQAAIFAKSEVLEKIKGKEYDWLKDVLPPYFPEQWLKDFAQKMEEAPTLRLPAINELSRLYGPATILIGDAGHSATPAMAMGANTGLMDMKPLSKALEMAGGDTETVGKIFNDLCWTDVRALQDLQMVHFAANEFVHGVLYGQAVEYEAFSLTFPDNWRTFIGWVHLVALGGLRRVLPSLITPRVYGLVDQGQLSPKQAMQILKRDAIVLSVAGILLLALLTGFVLVPGAKQLLS